MWTSIKKHMKLVVHQVLPAFFFAYEIFVLFFVLFLMHDYKSQRSGLGCLTHISTLYLRKSKTLTQVRSKEGKIYADLTSTP